MAGVGLGNGLLQNGISLGAVFNALAAAGTAETAAIPLPYVTNASYSTVFYGDIELIGSSTTPNFTTGAGSPYIQGAWLVANSGTNYDYYGTSNSQLFPINYTSFTVPLVPSITIGTVLRLTGLVLPFIPSVSANAKLVIFNNSGATFPTVVTATLYVGGASAG